MTGDQHAAVIEQMHRQAVALHQAYQARDLLVALLDLEPVSGRPDGRATWDDVIDYVAKALGTRSVLLATVNRRHVQLADALDLPHDVAWPDLLDRARGAAAAT